ncbi:class I SAM-dependent methyltransferase [Polynucleobacter paneuropaeus]|nr:class I SAM-dependent methyltransferase [Polynucleobacter paneuropaeus]MBT8577186.1 class I SAM-dependent methyltransferase [Polynucleobacter paneuropaeus]
MSSDQSIGWEEDGSTHSALWRSENGIRPHQKLVIADDTLTADAAYRMACEGTAILWRGDFQNARQLLQALARRVDKPSKKSVRSKKDLHQSQLDIFNLHRLAQSQRARTLGMLLIECTAEHHIDLRRAPDIAQACEEAYGPTQSSYLVSLRELLGVVGAHEWRKKGVLIPALSGTQAFHIHPHYGVFSPIRGEYIDLVNQAPLPGILDSYSIAFDIGVGTGILSIVLASRGIAKIIATDLDQRALDCAKDNIERSNFAKQIELLKTNLFPEGKAALIVCNPPWLPARPSSPLEGAIYDPNSQMLTGFLSGLKDHLLPEGEAWLVLSDLAEYLGLRSREQLQAWFDEAGVKVVDRMNIKPHHKKVFDQTDPLYVARSKEVTSLWRLILK